MFKKENSQISPTNLTKFFFNCVKSSDANINLIAWATIVAVGTASPKAWNKLTKSREEQEASIVL